MVNKKELSIDAFSSNCLMGVTGAIARYLYKIENLNRMYFHHSYTYQKQETVKIDHEKNCMNVWFSREIPMEKEQFVNRLAYYYGLEYLYAKYSNFDSMINDIAKLIAKGQPVMIEIDFFFMRAHRYYKKIHDMHMMIIYDIDFDRSVFHICEAVFGYMEMEFDEYLEHFNEIISNRQREINILLLKRKSENIQKINLDNFKADVDKTLNNLVKGEGISDFLLFKRDFLDLMRHKKKISNISIPGMWVFMCDHLNNYSFIKEFEKDHRHFKSSSLEKIKEHSVALNRKWFQLYMMLNEARNHTCDRYIKILDDIEEKDQLFLTNLLLLQEELRSYSV